MMRRRRRLAWAGLAAGTAAVLPPVDAWAGRLLTVHMAQHMTLVLVAAPLLAASGPVGLVAPALPRSARARVAAVAAAARRHAPAWWVSTSPAVGWVGFLAAVWAWHWPPAYDAALRSTAVHLLEHASLLAAGLAFWRPLVGWPPARRLPPGPAAVSLATTGVHTAALGALLVLAPRPLYGYAGDPGTGLDALTDQQIAGSLMWVASLPLFLAMLAWLVVGAARDSLPRLGWPP